MDRPSQYKTKQSEAIISYITSLCGEHVTAGQITSHFESSGTPIALTTVYRHLDKLTESGKLRRYTIDGVSGSYYQYIDESLSVQGNFYLKCESCGVLSHLDCSEVTTFRRHVLDEHEFQINPLKTMFYGKCKACCSEK